MDSAHITHEESLWERLDVLRDSGRHGAKTCQAMASFLKERATLENAYGEALVKASKRAAKGATPGGSVPGQTAVPPPVWAPSLVLEGWAGVVSSLSSWGKQHVGWAHCIDQNIAKTLTEFSEKHKGHVARLWAEAQELVSDLEVVQGEYYRAKGAYEQACIQASRLLDDRNKAREAAAAEAAAAEAAAADAAAAQERRDVAAKGLHYTAGPNSPKSKEAGGGSMLSSMSKMLLEKVGEGVAMAVSIAAGDLSLLELEEKVPEQLRKVDVAESEYIASIMAVNGYTTEFQPEMEAKLKQFQLLEESRIMTIRDVLLRMDEANRGMLECLLGPGGTLEALSIAFSRIDSVQDAHAQVVYMRTVAGMAPLASTCEAFSASTSSGMSGEPRNIEHGDGWTVRTDARSQDEILAAIAQSRKMTGAEVLELTDEGTEKAYEGGRDGMNEAGRVVQEICCCLGEVVSVEENHTRDMLRLLERQGYGSRVAESGVGGNRNSLDLHAIGATMEDVGKNVMANMSGSSSSSSSCAEVMSSEGQTLKKGWDLCAVKKVLINAEAHTGLARALADGSCSMAIKAHNDVKATVKRANKQFSTDWKQLVAAKSAHAKAVSRYDRLSKEAREKEETLSKARLDLHVELQAAGGASIVPEPPSAPPPLNSSAGTATAGTEVAGLEHTTPGDTAMLGGGGGSRRDAPSVLESLGLGHQPAGSRVRALEVKLGALIQERVAAKQAVQDEVENIETALVEVRRSVENFILKSFTQGSSRHASLKEVLEGVLSALLDTAKVLAAEQSCADLSKVAESIDGRRDVEELLERNVHRVPGQAGLAARARVGHGDGVGEVMFMAYHSEVLQRERDLHRKSRLSPTSALPKELRETGGEALGARRAGGGGHPLFTAMAEAALAQAHAKQQRRQILARREDAHTAGDGSRHGVGSEVVSGAADAAAQELATALTDGEGANFTRSRHRHRHRRSSRATGFKSECFSDSEVVTCDGNASRHGGSLHGVFLRGSRHGPSQGSRHGSKPYSRHGSVKSLRSGLRQARSSQHLLSRAQGREEVALDLPIKARGDVVHPGSSGVAVKAHGEETHDCPSSPVHVEHSSQATDGEARLADEAGASEGYERDSKRGSALPGGNNPNMDPQTDAIPVAAVATEPCNGDEAAMLSELNETTMEAKAQASELKPDDAGWGKPRVEPAKSAPVEANTPHQGDPEPAGDSMEEQVAAMASLGAEADIAGSTVTSGGDHGAAGRVDFDVQKQPEKGRADVPKQLVEGTFLGDELGGAPGEGQIAPTEEHMAPTEEQMAPTEETIAAHGNGEGLAKLLQPPLEYLEVIPRRQTEVGQTLRLSSSDGRASLRSLRHRLSHQEDFSSDGEAESVSSSEDERLSMGSSESDMGVGVAALYRDSSAPARVEQASAKQVSEDLNSLSSFDLPAEALQDKVLESYSSALYSGGLPLHGRLYITPNYALFSGWRNTKVVLPLSEVVGVEKTSTLGIVPNSLTLVKRDGEKFNFGSFLFRDDCYKLLTRLVNVSSLISRLKGPSPAVSTDELSPISASGGGSIADAGDEESRTRGTPPEPSEKAPGVAIARALAPASPSSDGHFENMIEAVLPCTTAQVFSWLWGRDTMFWSDFLRAQGEDGLAITAWRKKGQQFQSGRGLGDLFPGESFHEQRELTFTHPRTGFVVGPKRVVTRQAQGYRVERRSQGPSAAPEEWRGVAPMDRVVICQSTKMERGAPLADHFTILGKVVVTREPPGRDREPRCRVVVGFNVAFHKSTMLRGAIRSGAAEETSATWNAWLAASKKVVAYQRHRLGHSDANDGVATAPPAGVFKLAMGFDAGESVAGAVEHGARGVEGQQAPEEHAVPAFDALAAVKLVTSVARSLLERAVDTMRVTGVPTVLTLLCVFLVMLQQRDVRRLTGQVEELVVQVGKLRDQIND